MRYLPAALGALVLVGAHNASLHVLVWVRNGACEGTEDGPVERPGSVG